MNIQAVGIIRNRGQLTIPDKIRETFKWTAPSSTVTISSQRPDEIIIKPIAASKKPIDWDELWSNIKLSRAFKGRVGNLSKFIAKDREAH